MLFIYGNDAANTALRPADGRGEAHQMPLGISVVGALCAALLGFGCFKAVRLVSQIKAYKEGTKAVNVTLPADFLALQGGLLGGGAAIGRPLTFFRINDEVMGGKSTSSLAVSGRTLEFSGDINTNGGGFCSCRTLGDDAPLGLPAAMSALLVDATGDGQRHKLTLHTADSWAMSVPTWAADFIPGKRTTHRLPLASFVPSIRGRVLKVTLTLTLNPNPNPIPIPIPNPNPNPCRAYAAACSR